MKDKDLRIKVEDIYDRLLSLEMRRRDWERVKARHCPKCKHDTPQIYRQGGEYECLVCGSHIVCETVCKVVNEQTSS